MKRIIIGFSKPKNDKFAIYSWIIRAICRTPYSHVYVRIPTKYGVDLIYQASGLRVNFMGENHFNDHAVPVKEYSFDISDEAYEKFIKFAITTEGEKYSMKEAINIATYPILKRKLFKIEKEWVCSVIGAMVIEEFINENDMDFKDITLASPRDVEEVCELLSKKELSNG